MPEAGRALALGRAVGPDCKGTRAFHMGTGDAGSSVGTSFWSVACANGESYMVSIAPDAKGSTRNMSCTMLQRLDAGRCWTKLKAGPLRRKHPKTQ
jgi:hypothetical protein